MNYLAHIYLSGGNRRIQIGNFVGDAVKGEGYRKYPLEFQYGLLLHRRIDAFSDAHPLVRQAIGWGRPFFGRYAAVVTDIFFDHFLAVHFPEYARQSLRVFAFQFYGVLLMNYVFLPPRFRGFLWHFILTNRLVRYVSLGGICESLDIMVRYRGVQVKPDQAIQFLKERYEDFDILFQQFFPDLQAMCQRELVRLTT